MFWNIDDGDSVEVFGVIPGDPITNVHFWRFISGELISKINIDILLIGP